MPLTLIDVDPGTLPDAYLHKLVLCRADQHVVWRGDRLPARLESLVAMLCGRALADVSA